MDKYGNPAMSYTPRLLAVALLMLCFGLALTSAVQKSPTMDEQNHIARGAAYLGTGDPRLSVEHPPLINLLSALPGHLLLRPNLPLDTVWWEAGEWYHFADLFLWEANTNFEQIVFLARLPIVGIGLLLVSLVYRWAAHRFGPSGGLLAASFCALDPNILAHTRLSTTDVGAAFFILLAAYVLWRALRRPSMRLAVWTGLAMGLAFSAKLSALVFGPILGMTALLDGLPGGAGRVRRLLSRATLVMLAVLVGLLVVWAAYLFQVGPLDVGGPVVPAPTFLQGVRSVLGFAAGGRPAYLLGMISDAGWWYYFPVAIAVKTPIATLVGVLIAAGLALRQPSRDDLVLLVPPVAYLVISTTARLNLGYRHLLPILPFMAVHIGRLGQAVTRARHPRQRSARCLAAVLVIGLACATLSIYPHFLAYFNPIAGGPQNGWHVLADSNIDWGQDLKGLKAWMDREGVASVRLGWFGSARPEAYGIDFDVLPGLPHGFALWEDPPFNRDDPEPGVYAISVTNLVGVLFPDHDLYAWFRARAPDERIGHSVFIYRVEER